MRPTAHVFNSCRLSKTPPLTSISHLRTSPTWNTIWSASARKRGMNARTAVKTAVWLSANRRTTKSWMSRWDRSEATIIYAWLWSMRNCLKMSRCSTQKTSMQDIFISTPIIWSAYPARTPKLLLKCSTLPTIPLWLNCFSARARFSLRPVSTIRSLWTAIAVRRSTQRLPDIMLSKWIPTKPVPRSCFREWSSKTRRTSRRLRLSCDTVSLNRINTRTRPSLLRKQQLVITLTTKRSHF